MTDDDHEHADAVSCCLVSAPGPWPAIVICHENGTAVGYYFDVPGTCADGAYTVLKIKEMVKLHVCLEGWLRVKKPLRKDACWAVLGLIKSACVHNVWPVIAERDRRACAHLRLTLRSHLKYCTQILGVTCREERLDHPFVAGIPCFFTGGQPWPVLPKLCSGAN